jgi:prevent-host-death family protein
MPIVNLQCYNPNWSFQLVIWKMETTISATEFKARCLELMDQVYETRQAIIITKRGKPVSRLEPPTRTAQKKKPPLLGAMLGMLDDLAELPPGYSVFTVERTKR